MECLSFLKAYFKIFRAIFLKGDEDEEQHDQHQRRSSFRKDYYENHHHHHQPTGSRSLPFKGLDHQTVCSSPTKFWTSSGSSSYLTNPLLPQDSARTSSTLPVSNSGHSQFARSPELCKTIRSLKTIQNSEDNHQISDSLSKSKFGSVESTKRLPEIKEIFGITEPKDSSLCEQMHQHSRVVEATKKTNVKDFVLSSSTAAKSVSVSSFESNKFSYSDKISHDQFASLSDLCKAIGSLKTIQNSEDNFQKDYYENRHHQSTGSQSLPFKGLDHQSVCSSTMKFWASSGSSSYLTNPQLPHDSPRTSSTLLVSNSGHDKFARSPELCKTIRSLKTIQNLEDNRQISDSLSKSKLVSVELTKRLPEIKETFGMTEPEESSLCEQMHRHSRVFEATKKSNVKDFVVSSSTTTKSVSMLSFKSDKISYGDKISHDGFARSPELCKTIGSLKTIQNSEDNRQISDSLPKSKLVWVESTKKLPEIKESLGITEPGKSSLCGQMHQNSHIFEATKKSNVKDFVVRSSTATKSVSLSSFGSNKLSHDQFARSQEMCKTIRSLKTIQSSEDNRQISESSPKSKLVWMESTKKLPEIKESSNVKDFVVSSSTETKSVSVSSFKSNQNTPVIVCSPQGCIKSGSMVAGASLSLSKGIWVRKSHQEVQSEEKAKLPGVSKKYDTEFIESHVPSKKQNLAVYAIPEHLKVLIEKDKVPSLSKGIWVRKSHQEVQSEERAKLAGVSKKFDTEFIESHDYEIDEESLQGTQTVPSKKQKLPVYAIPEHLKVLIEKDKVPEVLRVPLSLATYTDYFAALLYAEDFYCEKWADFLLEDVTLELHEEAVKREFGNRYTADISHVDKKLYVKFEIDSVPERRPYLLSRDYVFLRHSGKQSRTFEGTLKRVMKSTHVLVEFGDDFYSQHSSDDRYDISFSFNRVCLKRCHQAVASAINPSFRHILFPDEFCCNPPTTVSQQCSSIWPIEDLIVHKITTRQGGPPYVINGHLLAQFYVVTKSILQIYKNSPSSRILICAPRNNICDDFVTILKSEIPVSELFRANAAFRKFDDVDDDVIPQCLFDGECFVTPPLLELEKFRVVTSTFVSSFRLHSCGITAGHFTHIFLVDASGATEPESMIALVNLAGEKTSIVITGNKWDQPPRVRSDIARGKGLKRSFFHRLLESYEKSSMG